MPRYLTLIRHAQSFANVGIRHIRNCGLTRKGIRQAKRIRVPFPVDHIYVSPMRRCQDTLMYSGLAAPHVITLPELREYKKDVCDFFDEETMTRESKEGFKSRVAYVKQYVRDNSSSDHLALVGHADFFWEFTNYNLGHEHFNISLDNAECFTVDRETWEHQT